MAPAPDNPAGGFGARLVIVIGGALVVALVVMTIVGMGGAKSIPDATSGSEALDAAVEQERNAPPGDRVAVVDRPTALRSKPGGGRRLARISTKTEFKSARVLAVVEERDGWLRVMASELRNGRTGWVDARHTSPATIDYRVRVDLSKRRIEVLKAGRVVRRMRAAVGEHGTPTPTGRFAVTDKVPFIDRGSAYGCCAIALTAHQPDTPSEWTGGDRIAIHATPMRQSIGRPVTLGCMRVPDADARWLMTHLPLGTQVSVRA
jgi:hypothetical protein